MFGTDDPEVYPDWELEDCPECGGDGEVLDDDVLGSGWPSLERCSRCGGQGTITIDPEEAR